MKYEVGLSPRMSGESETEEWWFGVRPRKGGKKVGKKRPGPPDEHFSRSSEPGSTSDATTVRWYEKHSRHV